MKHRFSGMLNLYVEKVGSYYDTFRGERFKGILSYEPPTDSAGNLIDDSDYPLHLTTYKEVTGGQSRTQPNYWLLSVMPSNYLMMNEETARELGLHKGDKIKIVSKKS
ncbi:MAG: hypothetical protein NXY59_06450 [Aigarchaeota archaeon]|nr:hypothetical protein [Candidatus Pelearchaeum maunauluense]